MVLSNKKLKQKVREAAAKLTGVDSATYAVDQSQPFLTCHKRFSKREKRRQLNRTVGVATVNGFAQVEERKKRKRCSLAGKKDLSLKKMTDSEVIRMPEKCEEAKENERDNLTTVSDSGIDASRRLDIGNKVKAVERETRKMAAETTAKENVEAAATSEDVKNSTCKKGKVKLASSKSMKAETGGDYQNFATSKHHCLLHSSEAQQQYDAKRVYVGGIPYYCSESDIKSYFTECGTITDINCMTFRDSGKFRGIALLTFMTEAAAKRALALDGADMGGLFLKIQPCKGKAPDRHPPSKAEGCTTAYIGNLSWDITEESIRFFFKDCNIKAIRFALDKSTGEFCGYGHIDFVDDKSLELAMQLDQQPVLGRPIRIAYAMASRTGWGGT